MASLGSKASDFKTVSAKEFFRDDQRKYNSRSFKEEMELVGEGTYGKVYKATLIEKLSTDHED